LTPRAGPIEPMTLGNMRANGVRSLLVYCTACPRTVVLNVDAYAETGAGRFRPSVAGFE
jgi:hypothetical protein